MRQLLVLSVRLVLSIISGIFIIVLLVAIATRDHIYTVKEAVPKSDAAIILGAAILRSGGLSPVLRDRANMAIALYETGTVKKIVASGDNSRIDYNEVSPIRTYLLKAGIPEEDIFVDFAGFDTYSSIYRAKSVFQIQSMVIVSQSFHLPRAVFIARQIGIDAVGMSADDGHYKINNYFRETLASVKAVWNILIDRQPKYLGEPIPITGDGRNSLPK